MITPGYWAIICFSNGNLYKLLFLGAVINIITSAIYSFEFGQKKAESLENKTFSFVRESRLELPSAAADMNPMLNEVTI